MPEKERLQPEKPKIRPLTEAEIQDPQELERGMKLPPPPDFLKKDCLLNR